MPQTPQCLRVTLPPQPRDYDILVGQDLLASAGEAIQSRLGAKRPLVISDDNVAPLYADKLEKSLTNAGLKIHPRIVVPAGEASKCEETFRSIVNQMFARQADRATTLIVALGGGVVGDLAGYVAATYMRCVPFVQVPTTLLAEVDSSVGGKTGIDTPHGKNTLGSFYQPKLVIADVATLATLPERERRAGYAEVIKYGLISDAPFYLWCEQHGSGVVAGDRTLQTEAVSHCCRMKADIVARDETDTGDERALLNLGHTFGHPLETLSAYSAALLHGEAVGIGLLLALRFSAEQGLCAPDEAARLKAHFQTLGLPTAPPRDIAWNADELVSMMTKDKKAKDGAVNLILLNGPGKAFMQRAVPLATLHDFWQRILAEK